MAIEINRIGWEDAPSEQTPIDSGNLKQMENNSEDGINALFELLTTNMTIYSNTEQSYSHTGSNIYLQEPLRFQNSRGKPRDKLTFVTNGIKIGAGINHINVKGIVTFRHSESDGRPVYLYIRKNGSIISTQIMYMQTMQPYSITIFTDYIEVQEGDLIQLYVAMDNANFKTAANTDNQLTVQVVD